jgi:hypothetical protein
MDLRLVAILLVLLGIVVGGMVSVPTLTYITTFAVGFTVVFLWRTNAPGGTSGALGLTLMVIGGMVSLLLPAWFVQLLK